MQKPERYAGAKDDKAYQRILRKIEKCLRQGCVIRIQYTSAMAPRFTPWREWCQSCCYNGDPQQVFSMIERCRETHFDHHIDWFWKTTAAIAAFRSWSTTRSSLPPDKVAIVRRN